MSEQSLGARRVTAGRKGDASLIIGAVLTLTLLAAALLSLVWLPYPMDYMDIPARLAPPGLTHPFGTDAYGRDTFSLVVAGSRTALLVGLGACGLGMGAGVALGLTAAARPGWLDVLLARTGDIVFAFPALLTAVLFAAAIGPGAGAAVAAIGIFNVPVFARLTRSAALRIWALDFVLTARAAGKGPVAVSVEHVLPNIAGLLLGQAAIQTSLAILAEAGLSYIGLGVQPPAASWGRMMAEAQTMVGLAPWLAIFPGLALMLTVLGLNLLAEGLRARLAPRDD